MNIGITGAGGFFGKHLIDKLKKERIVFESLDKSQLNLFSESTLRNFVRNKDIIIHLAGVTVGNNKDNLKANVLGTNMLLEAVSQYQRSARIILASTFQVYVPDSFHGLSKKQAEDLVLFYSRLYKIKSIILRFTNIYGSGCRPNHNSVIATFIHNIRQGKPIVINGSGRQTRDFLFIDDATNAIIKAIDYVPDNTIIVDICTGKKRSLIEVINILKRYHSMNIKVTYNKMREVKPWHITTSCAMANKIFNWKPIVSLEEGIDIIMRQYNEHNYYKKVRH